MSPRQTRSANKYVERESRGPITELKKIMGDNELLDDGLDAINNGDTLDSNWTEQIVSNHEEAVADAKAEANSNLGIAGDIGAGNTEAEKLINGAIKDVGEGKPLPTNLGDKLESILKSTGAAEADIKKAKIAADSAVASAKKHVDGLAAKGNVKTLAKKAADAIAANAIVKQALAAKSAAGSIPTGNTMVVVAPALSNGLIFAMPGGGLIVGSGGAGHLHVMTADASQLLGVPIGAGDPLPEVDDAGIPIVGVLLRNPVENGATVQYVIDSQWNHTLQPGFSQQLDSAAPRQIGFNRGVGRGQAVYDLVEGTYAFGPAGGGWDLYRQTFSVTIDNSDGDQGFAYVVDNRRMRVPAGRSRTHKSDFPIVLRFNRGGPGQDSNKRITTPDEQLLVAVNPADGLWDLFPADGSESGMVAGTNLPPSRPNKAPNQPQPEGDFASMLRGN
jgi:hypothetical protein